MRVMLVEDDHNVMMVTKHYIESFGHEVVTAPDGETAGGIRSLTLPTIPPRRGR